MSSVNVARPLTGADANDAEIVLEEGTYGLRYDKSGRVLEHSILGSIQDYEALAGKSSTLQLSGDRSDTDDLNGF